VTIEPLENPAYRARLDASALAYDHSIDHLGRPGSFAIADAVAEAMRVRITPEIMRAALRVSDAGRITPEAIASAFRAAGFEVEQ
jgi:hypothetical protein